VTVPRWRRQATAVALAACAALLVLAGCAALGFGPGSAQVVSAWTQYGPQGQLSVRAIVPAGATCPAAEINGVSRPLAGRAAASEMQPASGNRAHQPWFDVRSCELSVPAAEAKRIRLAGRDLPVAPVQARRIVVLGDTGCRVKISEQGKGDPMQDCADPAAWPWAKIAAAAARTQPDVVVHVGDYHYREYCDHREACKPLADRGEPVGYGWAGWQADFFGPARPLLAVAPWVMVRGNHENCDRAGEGWMRFLSPVAYTACPDQRYRTATGSVLGNNFTASAYTVALGSVALVVADNAGQEDYRPASETPDDGPVFERTLGGVFAEMGASPVWLLSHRPIWYDLLAPKKQPNAFQMALKGLLDGKLQLAFAGHQHGFSTLAFAPGAVAARPAQVIVGGGGSQLEALDPGSPFYEGKTGPGSRERQQPDGRLYDGVPAASGIVLNRYSFLLLDRAGAGWDGQLIDPDGRTITRCRLEDGKKMMSCAFPDRATSP